MPNWKKVITSGSDAALNSLLVTNGITGSLLGTASYAANALSASYALNGGVTQLLAGPNITLSPTNGQGQVTVTATLSGSNSYNTSTGSYGSFYDTTTQTNPVANIARSMSFNSTDITNGVSISGSTSPFNTYIKTENAGVYDIQFSAQVDKTDGGTDDIVIWLRKNGIDLTDTATTLTLPTNNSKVVAAWNWFVSSATGDYYQIIWRSADVDLRLLAEPISVDHPGIPSVIATVNRVDQFLSNTGSFSGSFTGTLTGTASYATQALSSSYALSASHATSTAAISGTTNYVSKFTSGTTIGNSQIFDNGTNVGIGTTSPSAKLDVSGSAIVSGSLTVTGATTSNSVTAVNMVATNGISIQQPAGFYYPSIGFYNNGGAFQGNITGYNGKLLTTNVIVQSGYSLGVGFGAFDSIYAQSQVLASSALSTDNSFAVVNNPKTGYHLKVNNAGNVQTGVGGLSIPRTDTPNGTLLGTIFYGTNGNFWFDKPIQVSKIVNNGQTLSYIELTDFSHTQQTTGAWADAPNAFVFRSNGAQGLNSNSNNFFTVANDSNNLLTIKVNGNVGIGKTAPNAKLDVSGSTIITGSLTVTQGITGSLLGTSSYSTQALSSSYADTASYYGGSVTSASYATTASYVLNAVSASYATQALSASYASTTNLTVGSTPITSGTNGRILFQNGGVLQQTGSLSFGTGLKVLSNGANDSFVINDSTDTNNLFKVTKEGYFYSNYYWQFNRLNGSTLELYSLNTGFSFREGGAPFALLGLNESTFGNTNTNNSVLSIRTSASYGGEYPLGSIIQGLGTNGSVVLSPLSTTSSKAMLGYYNGTSYASALEYNNTSTGGTVVKLLQNGSGAVSIGQSTNGARLDVRAQGALSTDLALRVRNSANTADLLSVQGNGITNLGILSTTGDIFINEPANGLLEINSGGGINPQLYLHTSNSGTKTVCGFLQGDGNGWLRLMGGTRLNIGTGTAFAMTVFSNQNVSVGTSSDLSARFGILAQGALSTDIAFKVRNSAGTADLFNVVGTGQVSVFNNSTNSSLSSMDPTNTFAAVTLENFSLVNTTFKKVLGIQSYAGSGLRYLTMSSLDDLHWNHRFTVAGRLTATAGIACINVSNDFNSSTISNLYGVNLINQASISMRPDFNLAQDENTLGLFIAPGNTLNPTKKLIKLMDSTLTNTFFTVNGLGQVGIGTSSPTKTLQVVGTTSLSSSFNTAASGSTLTVYGSGSAQPVFTVQGSQGELFSVTDSLSGSLFSVNDISGLPIMEVFSDNTTLMGSYQDPMLITTTKLVTTASGAFTLYSLPTASYDTAFFEYSIRSGSNARAGSIMAVQLGSTVNFTETTTTDFGSTSGFGLTVQVAGANMILTGSATTAGWTIKTIVRGI
jgi:hypothetical protein